MLGARLGVCAGVDQDGRAPASGDDDGDRRAIDTREAAKPEQAGGEHRARVPGRDDGVGSALPDRAARGNERGVRLRTHGLGRLLVHRDLLRRLHELEISRIQSRRAEQDRLDAVGTRSQRAGDDLLRSAVAS